ncbi:iron-sulfur cluster loop [Thermogladius sp. 4427co]|uniref:iron-sulfur cluster loop n=1 Tax=Thermogladius sp. 4427co TaxID=3450718 RepID=UPI003F7A5CBB
MEVTGLDERTIERIGRILVKHFVKMGKLDVFDERFYPSRNAPPETVTRYFMVMVAMDHRLSRPGRPYEACLEDGCYHGADLLYRLGKLKLEEDPDFYSPERLSNISVDEVVKWLSVGEASPPDPEVRAFLLRDLGFKLLKLYNGSVLELLNKSNNRVRGDLEKPGLVENLRVFRAFEDPVEKKAMLLAKFLKARGLFNPVDDLDVAVDNHLTRQAIRLGMVMVSGDLWNRIRAGREINPDEDICIRLLVKKAYRLLASYSGLKPEVVDDIFWLHGRTICLRDSPKCDECVFRQVCLARRNKSFMVNEPVFYNTWYY